MTELQHGILQYCAAGLIFAVGILFGRLIEQGRQVERKLLGLEAERLARSQARQGVG